MFHLPFEFIDFPKFLSDNFRKKRKISHKDGKERRCLETISEFGARKAKNKGNDVGTGDRGRTTTMTLRGNKAMKKDISGQRHFKRKRGMCLSEFTHVTDEDKHIHRCFRDNLSPTNQANQHIFDLLNNSKNNAC